MLPGTLISVYKLGKSSSPFAVVLQFDMQMIVMGMYARLIPLNFGPYYIWIVENDFRNIWILYQHVHKALSRTPVVVRRLISSCLVRPVASEQSNIKLVTTLM